MPRKANVITICFNEELNRGSTQERNLSRAMSMLDTFADMKPDLICFPEVFLKSGNDGSYASSEEWTRKAYDALSERARQLKSYIIASAHETIDSKVYNVGWLFDREGRLAGRYCKNYLTIGEIDKVCLTPGTDIPVFETDFGKIGIAICYDIGFRQVWDTLEKKGAELVAWLSAYDGGFPLECYAWLHSYYIVSSVRTNHSKIIDKTGKIISSSSRWGGWASSIVDLDKQIFHIDEQYHKLPEVQRRLGSKVTIEGFTQENIFTLESHDQEWPMDRICAEFKLEPFKQYHARAERVRNASV